MDKFKFFFSATVAAALLSLLLLTPATWAQDATGKIAGNITDASGAVVPGAKVVGWIESRIGEEPRVVVHP